MKINISINQIAECLLFFKLSDNDIEKNNLSFYISSTLMYKFPFPISKIDSESIKKLKTGFPLSEDNQKQRNAILRNVPVSDSFILSILAHRMLSEFMVDYRDIAIQVFKAVSYPPLMSFVSMPGQKNIFFVLDYYEREDCSLLCVEVHPSLAITYNLCRIGLNQVLKAKWAGPKVDLSELNSLLDLTEEEFVRRMSDIEMKGSPDSDR